MFHLLLVVVLLLVLSVVFMQKHHKKEKMEGIGSLTLLPKSRQEGQIYSPMAVCSSLSNDQKVDDLKCSSVPHPPLPQRNSDPLLVFLS